MVVVLCLACVVVTCLLFALVLLHVRAPRVCVRDSMPLQWYLDEKCHSGDLVFFRSPRVDFVHDFVSPMTHVGMVVMHPLTGEPLFLEMHDDKTVEGSPPGVHLYPARERLTAYRGALFVIPITNPLSATDVLGVANDQVDVPYPAAMRMHIAKCKLIPGFKNKRGKVCSEFIMYVLAQLGVMCKAWRCVTPSELMHSASKSDEYATPCHLVNKYVDACHGR